MKDIVIQKLPDPFLFRNGTRVKSPADWKARRTEIADEIINILYGGLPPAPEIMEFIVCQKYPMNHTYLIIAGTRDRQLSFEMQLFLPAEREGRLPVILTGDGGTRYMDPVIDTINARGFIAARFNKSAIVPDLYKVAEIRKSPLYRVYPEIQSGSLAGWAWGFHRCLDVLTMLDEVDKDNIALTGHSRGGKTALIAGAYDDRAAYVNPNNSGAGGVGTWRFKMLEYHDEAYTRDSRSEDLSDCLNKLPFWFSPELEKYRDREDLLPFDQHFLISLAAPRFFLSTEGFSDFWSNPRGSRQSVMAASEVYKLLGAQDKIYSRYRTGGHAHSPGDFEALMDLMDYRIHGKPLDAAFTTEPYPGMAPVFDWRCPEINK